MIPLPPYHAELNLVELVFQTLVSRVMATISRSGMCSPNEFKNNIISELATFSHNEVRKMYINCGYAKVDN